MACVDGTCGGDIWRLGELADAYLTNWHRWRMLAQDGGLDKDGSATVAMAMAFESTYVCRALLLHKEKVERQLFLVVESSQILHRSRLHARGIMQEQCLKCVAQRWRDAWRSTIAQRVRLSTATPSLERQLTFLPCLSWRGWIGKARELADQEASYTHSLALAICRARETWLRRGQRRRKMRVQNTLHHD
jgi:hypothetical protein